MERPLKLYISSTENPAAHSFGDQQRWLHVQVANTEVEASISVPPHSLVPSTFVVACSRTEARADALFPERDP